MACAQISPHAEASWAALATPTLVLQKATTRPMSATKQAAVGIGCGIVSIAVGVVMWMLLFHNWQHHRDSSRHMAYSMPRMPGDEVDDQRNEIDSSSHKYGAQNSAAVRARDRREYESKSFNLERQVLNAISGWFAMFVTRVRLLSSPLLWKMRQRFRPPPKPGFRRFEWTCSCTKRLSGDYRVRTEHDAQELQDFFDSFAISTEPDWNARLSTGQDIASGSASAKEGGVSNSQSAASKHPILAPQSILGSRDPTAQSFPLDVPSFFELCIRRNARLTCLGEITLTDGQCNRRVCSDKELFSKSLSCRSPEDAYR